MKFGVGVMEFFSFVKLRFVGRNLFSFLLLGKNFVLCMIKLLRLDLIEGLGVFLKGIKNLRIRR